MNYLAMLLQGSADGMQQQVQQTMMMMIPIFMVAGIICLAVILIPFWFICKKAGFSPWLTLLNLVPLGGLVLVYVLAFAEFIINYPLQKLVDRHMLDHCYAGPTVAPRVLGL